MSNPHADPLLAAKLSVPALPPNHVRRPRLLDQLSRASRSPLTAVTAAAGYGKTTLVSAWARAGLAPGPLGWLTLDGTTNSPGTFWPYLGESLRRAVPGLAEAIAAPGRVAAADRSFPTRLTTGLVGLGEPVALVLDRCELLTNRSILADLDALLRDCDSQLRLVVVGRSVRSLPLHRYRLTGELTELCQEDLALRPTETAEILHRYGVELARDGLTLLQESTEGWVAGLCLQALAWQPGTGPPDGTHHVVADYLRAEVLDGQPPRVRDLLLRTSVVEEIHPDLADRLTGRTDARATLEELARAHTFLAPLGAPPWYRCLGLFREVLRDELTASHPGLARRLHSSAAHWYADHDRIPAAIHQAAQAGDWDLAVNLAVSRLGICHLYADPDDTALRRLFAGLPGDRVGGPAALVRSVLALARSDTGTAAAELARARDRADGHLELRHGIAVASVILGRLRGDTEAAERATTEVEQVWAQLPAAHATEQPWVRSLVLSCLGSARMWAGHEDAAQACLRRAATPDVAGTEYAAHDALGQLALLDLRHGKLQRAHAQARESIAVAERAGLRPSAQTAAASTALAGVALQRNDLPAVREHLARASAAAKCRQDPQVTTAIGLLRADAANSRGDGRRALAAVEALRANLSDIQVPPAVAETLTLTTALAYLCLGDPSSALHQLGPLPESPERTLTLARIRVADGDRARAVALLAGLTPQHAQPATLQAAALLRAEVSMADGTAALAAHGLREALEYARPEQRSRPFVESGAWVRQLLRQYPELAAEHTWLPTELTGSPVSRTAVHPVPPVDPLTERESAVIRRLAQGMSTKDIAAELYLSVNTVKTHLKSIYRKLGAAERSTAARRARELGLLDGAHPQVNPARR